MRLKVLLSITNITIKDNYYYTLTPNYDYLLLLGFGYTLISQSYSNKMKTVVSNLDVA